MIYVIYALIVYIHYCMCEANGGFDARNNYLNVFMFIMCIVWPMIYVVQVGFGIYDYMVSRLK